MNVDPRLVALRLAGTWAAKVERDELELTNSFDMLCERINAIVHTTCPTAEG